MIKLVLDGELGFLLKNLLNKLTGHHILPQYDTRQQTLIQRIEGKYFKYVSNVVKKCIIIK